jgi:hypothetical protein
MVRGLGSALMGMDSPPAAVCKKGTQLTSSNSFETRWNEMERDGKRRTEGQRYQYDWTGCSTDRGVASLPLEIVWWKDQCRK